MTTKVQDAHALTTYFIKKYKVAFDQKPTVNRNTARWGWDSILMDLDVTEVEELIDYYFTVGSSNGHDIKWFFYNYDSLIEAKQQQQEDQERLKQQREETRIRTEKWRERLGNNRSESN